MRIVHVMDSGGLYGAEQVVLHLAAGLKARGHSVVFAGFARASGAPGPLELAAKALGIDVWQVPGGSGLSGIRRFLERVRAAGVDVIHSHGYKAHILLGLSGTGPEAPANVATLHGWTARTVWSRVWLYGCLERCLLHRFDAVVAVHGEMAHARNLPARVRGKLGVIHNGLPLQAPPGDDAAESSQPECLRAFRIPGRTIGVVGRLSPEKGIDVLIDAMGLLRDAGDPARLVVVGDGSLRAVLEARVQRLGLGARVKFAGFLPRAESMLQLFDVLALPSWQEGLPMVLLEAMRARVPVVASGVGGVIDLLDNGACGWLVPPGDSRALAMALVKTLDGNETTRARTSRAWERFASRFTVDAMVDGYLECYARVVGARGTRGRAAT